MSARILVLVSLVAAAVLMVLSSPAPLVAHGGGLDGIGCHHDNKVGNYHCHRGTCAGQIFPSKAAAEKAGCKAS